MRISLLSIGRCRTAYLREGVADYARRIRHYADLEFTELREERASGGQSRAEIRRREGGRLLRAIPATAFVAALDPGGRTCSSEALADRLAELSLHGRSHFAFLIGGAFGLSPEVLERAEWRLSLSPMTLPHELARLVLLEQLYRACTIHRGESYHK